MAKPRPVGRVMPSHDKERDTCIMRHMLDYMVEEYALPRKQAQRYFMLVLDTIMSHLEKHDRVVTPAFSIISSYSPGKKRKLKSNLPVCNGKVIDTAHVKFRIKVKHDWRNKIRDSWESGPLSKRYALYKEVYNKSREEANNEDHSK